MANDSKVDKNENLEQPSAGTENTDIGGIPYSRFKSVVNERNEYRATIGELESQVETLNKKISKANTDNEGLLEFKKELDEYKQKKFNADKTKWDGKKKLFDVKEGDPLFEKVEKIKHRFSFGEELSPSQVAQNLAVISTYEEIDYFSEQKQPTGYSAKKPGGKTPAVEGDFYGYKNIEELARNDWKKAGEWFEKNKK